MPTPNIILTDQRQVRRAPLSTSMIEAALTGYLKSIGDEVRARFPEA